MSTLKEIHIKASQGKTLPDTPQIDALNTATNGSEEDMEKAFSDFFAAAEFNKNKSNSFENHLLSEFIKEINKDCSLPIQRITSDLMKHEKLCFNKKTSITEACLIILLPEGYDQREGMFTTLLKSAASQEINAVFAFAQVLKYVEIRLIPMPEHSELLNKLSDACVRNFMHPNMYNIFQEFLQSFSQKYARNSANSNASATFSTILQYLSGTPKPSQLYFRSITLKYGLTNVILNEFHYPAGLLKRLCEWGKNHLAPQNESDCFFLSNELPSLMLDCIIERKTEVIEDLVQLAIHFIKIPEFNEHLSTVSIDQLKLKQIADTDPNNAIFSDILEQDSDRANLSEFLTGIRYCVTHRKKSSATTYKTSSPANAADTHGVFKRPPQKSSQYIPSSFNAPLL